MDIQAGDVVPSDKWLDETFVTFQYCPRCLYKPFHGAKDLSICCGLPFVTSKFTARKSIEKRMPFASVAIGRVLGGEFKHNSQHPTPEGRFGGLFHFPTQEALDNYEYAKKIAKDYPWSREWAIKTSPYA